MTETRIWLEARRRELARRTAGAGALLTAGLVLVALAAGIGLARLGLYQHLPLTVLVAWLAVPCAVACGIVWWRRRGRGLGWASLAAAVERGGGQRRGLVEGIAAWDGEHGSAARTCWPRWWLRPNPLIQPFSVEDGPRAAKATGKPLLVTVWKPDTRGPCDTWRGQVQGDEKVVESSMPAFDVLWSSAIFCFGVGYSRGYPAEHLCRCFDAFAVVVFD